MARILVPLAGVALFVTTWVGTTGSDGSPPGAGPVTSVTVVDGERVHIHPGPWRLVGVSSGGTTVHVQIGLGGCTRFQGFEVDESRHSVAIVAVMHTTIGPLIDQQREPFSACPDIVGAQVAAVDLERPLGERHLVGECRGGQPSCEAFASIQPGAVPGVQSDPEHQ